MTFHELQKKVGALVNDRQSTAGEYLACGTELNQHINELPTYVRTLRAAFLSSYTITSLPETVRGRGIFHNLAIECYTAPYNQFNQEITNPSSQLYQFIPQIIYLLLDRPDILSEDHMIELIDQLAARTTAQIVIANFFESDKLNASLQALTKNRESVHVLDFVSFINNIGIKEFWYTKYKELGDLRLAPQAFPDLAEVVLGYAVATAGNSKKCLLLDLDNTLWEGVVGEDGLTGIKPNIPLQQHILNLYETGVILTINSKNNFDDAMEAIENHPKQLLRKHHFAAWRINWQDKDANTAELADELNLGLDSFVLFDDDNWNAERMRSSLPEVAVLHPNYAIDYTGFTKFHLTDEDRKRSEMYVKERERTEFKQQFKTTDHFIKELKLEITIKAAMPEAIARISQLTQKTNQFNLMTRRYSVEEVRGLLAEGQKIWTLEAHDVFGDYGIVGVAMVKPGSKVWEITNFLMSCRVLGRGIEESFFNHILAVAKQAKADKVTAQFIPTTKNKPSVSALPDAGFTLIDKEGEIQNYEFDLGKEPTKSPYIKVTVEG